MRLEMRTVLACLVIGAAASPCAPGSLYPQESTSTVHAATAPPATTRTEADRTAPLDPLGAHISIMLVDAPLVQALATISAQSGVRLTYSSDDLSTSQRVSLAERNISVGAALQAVLVNSGLHPVAMADGAIVLTTGSAQPAASPTSAPLATPAALLTGQIIQPDGTGVQGATLGLMGRSDTLTTTDSGRFVARDVSPGAYLLWVRHIGFHAARMPITVLQQRPTAVTITLVPTVPSLPTVTTTAQVRAGYHDVGLDQRMQAGLGQFVTYDQIVRRHATQVTQLLQGLRGVSVGEMPALVDGSFLQGVTVHGARGPGSCASLAIDGAAQGVVDSRDIDNLIQPSDVGAIEVYTAPDASAGLRGAPLAVPPQPPGLAHPPDPVQCTLIALWTRKRLGISASHRGADSTTATVRH